jgi:hypothetical protein
MVYTRDWLIKNVLILKSNEDGFLKIFFLLFPEDDDFTVLFCSASSDRPCIIDYFPALQILWKMSSKSKAMNMTLTLQILSSN